MNVGNGNGCQDRRRELEERGIDSGRASEIVREEHAIYHAASAEIYESAKTEALDDLTFRSYDENYNCVLSLHVYQAECPLCTCHFVSENLTEDEDDDFLLECVGCGTVWTWGDWDDWDV
jgi:hypothetical protein